MKNSPRFKASIGSNKERHRELSYIGSFHNYRCETANEIPGSNCDDWFHLLLGYCSDYRLNSKYRATYKKAGGLSDGTIKPSKPNRHGYAETWSYPNPATWCTAGTGISSPQKTTETVDKLVAQVMCTNSTLDMLVHALVTQGILPGFSSSQLPPEQDQNCLQSSEHALVAVTQGLIPGFSSSRLPPEHYQNFSQSSEQFQQETLLSLENEGVVTDISTIAQNLLSRASR